MGSVIGYQEAHGPVATFETDVAGKIRKLEASIEPVQDLHGYDHPWPAGGGKNLLDPSKRTSYGSGRGQRWYESEGFTLKANQTYTFSVTYANPIALYIRDKATGDNLTTGNTPITYTPTADTAVYFQAYRGEDISSVDTFQLELGSTATTYFPYSNICPITGWTGAKVTKCGKNLLDISKNESGGIDATGAYVNGDIFRRSSVFIPCVEGQSYTLSTQKYPNWTMRIYFYDSDHNFIIRHQTNGSVTQTAPTGASYIKWSIYKANVAFTREEVEASELQLEKSSTATTYEPYQGSTYDIAFPSEAGTVYGGTLDVVKGELVVDRAQIASYNWETLPGEWISDRDAYVAGASPTTGAQVVYELATPIIYQLTPQEINTIIGTNTIYADTGDTSVIYPKTITPEETISNLNLMELRRGMIASQPHLETKSGDMVSFNTNIGAKAKKLIVNIEPVQDLHGHDHSWYAGGGKNLIPLSLEDIKAANTNGTWSGNSYTYNGLTFTVLVNEIGEVIGVTVNGTNANSAVANLYLGPFNSNSHLQIGLEKNYYISGGAAKAKMIAWRYDSSGNYIDLSVNHSTQIGELINNSESVTQYTPVIQVAGGATVQSETVYPMVYIGTSQAPAFEPYSNICPITGWTGVSVNVNSDVINIAFSSEAGTVYGGILNMSTGDLTVTDFVYTFDGTENIKKSSVALNGYYIQLYRASRPHNWPEMADYSYINQNTKELSSMFTITYDVNEYLEGYGFVYFDSGINFSCDPEIFGNTVTAVKTKLANLYSAGTPVSFYLRILNPIVYHLSPQQINLIKGANNVFADCGDTTITYWTN